MQSSEMEKTNPPAYTAPGQQQPGGFPQQPIEMAGQQPHPQYAQHQSPMPVQGQSPPPMMHQQSYGIGSHPQSPQPMAGQPQPIMAHSPSPHAQQPYGSPAPQGFQQQSHQFPPQQGVQQPGMVYQQPHMDASKPGFVQQHSGGIVNQQPGAGNAPTGHIYQSAVPIATLGDSPAPVDCPSCHQRAMTSTTHVAGDCTHLWALGAFFVTCCCCWVPYLIDSMKDTVHKCSKCGVTIATAKRSGGTQVHAFA